MHFIALPVIPERQGDKGMLCICLSSRRPEAKRSKPTKHATTGQPDPAPSQCPNPRSPQLGGDARGCSVPPGGCRSCAASSKHSSTGGFFPGGCAAPLRGLLVNLLHTPSQR